MNRFRFIATSAIILTSLFLADCGRRENEEAKHSESMAQSVHPSANNSVAGIRWNVPSSWTKREAGSMRIATYATPQAEGDTEAGECAVFYFGSNQGGDVDANIDRWIGQFEQGSSHNVSSKELNGLSVKMVQVAGAYLAPGGPAMQSQGSKENYLLLGAIVTAPEGFVFFKLTGPAKTIATAENDFNSLINSLQK